ncbi:MAG: transketolase C-terminal domain-containing protein, partial [Rhodothermales bacterium]
ILMGAGSEVHIALSAQTMLDAENVRSRVVSMPSFEVFEQQPASYREDVLPPGITARVSVEAGVTMGWDRFVGSNGASIGLHRFGESAPYKEVYEDLGITADAVVAAAKRTLDRG